MGLRNFDHNYGYTENEEEEESDLMSKLQDQGILLEKIDSAE